MTSTDTVLMYHHLGLGDHFICNGLVRYALQELQPRRMYIPTKIHNFPTVSMMYSDDQRIVCIPIETDADVSILPELNDKIGLIVVGFEKCRLKDWDVSFYDSVGISFDIRWNYFKVNRNPIREILLESFLDIKDGEKFILVHEDGSSGNFPIQIKTDLRVVKVKKHSDSLMDWCGVIEKAEEVHCIDSSFIHVAQMMNVKTGVFHNNRPSTGCFVLRSSWSFRDYNNNNQ